MNLRTILICVAAAAAGCSTPAPDSAAPQVAAQPGPEAAPEAPTTDGDVAVEGKLVVLSARDEKFMEPLWDLVRSKHPNLELVVDYGKDAPYLDRLRAEKDAPRADLFLSKGSAAIAAAAKDGLLAEMPADLRDRVPERDRGDRWVGLSKRARVIVARRDLADAPSTIAELADPKYAGRLARTVATNSSFVGGVTTVLADAGEEGAQAFLQGLHDNTKDGPHVYPKHTPAVAAVVAGQADLALVNHYYFYRAILGKEYDAALTAEQAQSKLDEAPVVAIFPSDESGVAWNVTGGGIVDGGPNPAAARAVLDVLLSPEGQQAFAWTNREYPVVEGVPAAAGVRPASEFRWSDAPLIKLAELQPKAVELIQAAGLR
jgi:iron(III) transport system substrate-binding protein